MINNVTPTSVDPVVPAMDVFEEDATEIGAAAEPVRTPARRTDRGMVSAEWAVGIIAAIAIAGVLLAVVTSGPVKTALMQFILLVIHSFSGFIGK